jgi:hypothetical protein
MFLLGVFLILLISTISIVGYIIYSPQSEIEKFYDRINDEL